MHLGFFAVSTTQIWHFLESASTQRTPLTFYQPSDLNGVPSSHFHQPKRYKDEGPPLTLIKLHVLTRGALLSLSNLCR